MTSPPDSPEPERDYGPLLAAVQQGDRGALEVIVRECYDDVERAVQRRLRVRFRSRGRWMSSLFSTGDIVHGVFLKVLAGKVQLDEPTRPRLIGYLVRTVEAQIVDTTRFHQAARRDRRRLMAPTASGEHIDGATDAAATPLEQAWSNEQRAIYREVLQSFDERGRQLLTRRLEHGHSFEEIASRLGYRTVDAARKAFHTAKARLLVRLGARGIDVAPPREAR
ncbi:MAG: sigma-70 family RNA polymerase sigma factor [Planctomycetes bacterium]|nr:sigma-70 family RNA polymerase sigma factor [Planctomycetota bacterium]